MKNTLLEELRTTMITHASEILCTSPNIGLLGAVVEKKGTVSLATADGSTIEDVASALATMFRSQALAGEISAAGLFWVQRHGNQGDGQSEGVFTYCEILGGQSELCVTPYTRISGQAPCFANHEVLKEGQVQIFDSALMDELRTQGLWPVIDATILQKDSGTNPTN